jgi:hypothetical protein
VSQHTTPQKLPNLRNHLRNGPKEINQHDESVPYPIVDGTLPALSLSLSLSFYTCRTFDSTPA